MTHLPQDADGILKLAARSMFDLFAHASEGMLLVDRQGRVVWINDQYRRFLPALGYASEDAFLGQPVNEVVQNTQMHQVLQSGRPSLVDLIQNRAGSFVVSRIPLRNDAGDVIGVLGIVLLDQSRSGLQPLVRKFAAMEKELEDAKRELAQRRAHGQGGRRAKYNLSDFVGTSAAAQEAKRHARRAARVASPVLLLGETGTGKELLAHAIHGMSSRADKPLVSVNIAAIPDTLLEAEFFGVAPGAYTGADRKGRQGKLALADGGTLFLDEIGDMPLPMQAKLLRALQEQEFEALGSNEVRSVDVRIIAATSRDLPSLVAQGAFREDLYYRLNVLPIAIAPLRARREDIALLVETLCDGISQQHGLLPCEFAADALQALAAQTWRGNIRELRNVLEQLLLRSEGAPVRAADVHELMGVAAPGQEAAIGREPVPWPVSAPGGVSGGAPDRSRAGGAVAERNPALGPDGAHVALAPLGPQVRALEQQAIRAAMQVCGGNKLAVAKALGMSRAKLYERLRDMPEFQAVV